MLWNNSNKFKELYYKSLIDNYQTYNIQGLTDIGVVTLELEKVYVLPYVVVKNPQEVTGKMVQKAKYSESLSIWDFFSQFAQETAYRRILLLGGPGTGKTLLLEYLTLVYAQSHQRQVYEQAPKLIPILVYLRQVRKLITGDRHTNLPGMITKIIKRVSSLKLDPSETWFEQQLTQGKCLVMFDGLDEVINPSERQVVGQWLDRQMQLYPENPYIITSRPYGYLNHPLEQITICLELQTYNSQQREQFLHKFYWQQNLLQQAKQDEQILRDTNRQKASEINKIIKNHQALNYITSNPLLLTLLAFWARKPSYLCQKRLRLYQQMCQLLLQNRPQAKGVPGVCNLSSKQIQLILQKLALELMLRQKHQFTLEEGLKIIAKPLEKMVDQSCGSHLIQYVTNITGLLQEVSVKIYQFIHLNIQEYLAAMEIKQTKQEKILIDRVTESWWSETIRLYAACSDTTQIILAAWNQRTILTMNLAYDCWEQGKKVNPNLQLRLENWLEAALESEDPEIARLAAKVQLSRRLRYAVVTD